MATQSYTAYSDYDPEKDRERLLRETGQIEDDDSQIDAEEQWRKEASRIYKRASLADSAPKFVPAKVADGEWDSIATAPTLAGMLKGKESGNVAGWYKSLTASSSAIQSVPPSALPTPGPSRPPSAPASTAASTSSRRNPSKVDKSNWFIQNVISASTSSAPASTCHTPFSISLSNEASASSTPAPPPTLAEILERDPPQEGKLTPPVWIALGPGNKGFGMLQKSGWNEGEALGPYAMRMKRAKDDVVDVDSILGGREVEKVRSKGKAKQREQVGEVKVEYVEAPLPTRKRAHLEDDDDVVEVKKVEVVDLTLDSDDSDESDEGEEEPPSDSPPANDVKIEDDSTDAALPLEDPHGHGGTALLTPLSTILKSDKLGIGLKPKLTSASSKGAYRIPILKDTRRNQVEAGTSRGFRVTSTQAVLDELRRRERLEREREVFGKGRRGKERKSTLR